MTAPIQEPNLYRHASGLQWGQNQLFRRPAPQSGDTYPWIVLVNTGQDLAGDNAFHESLFVEAYWDPTITEDPTAGGGVFFIDQVDDGEGNDYWSLTCNEEGWHDIEVVHQLEETTSDGGANVYFSQETVIGAAVFDADTPLGYTAPWPATGAELAVMPYISTFRRVWIQSGQQLVTTSIKQNSGVSKSGNGHIKVFYLAGLGGGTQNTDWDVAVIT